MLKKLIVILLFSPLPLKAQDIEINRKLHLGLSIIPEVNGLLVDKRLEQRAKPRIGFSAGIDVKRNLTIRHSLISGLHYGMMRYDYIQEGLIFPTDIDPLKGIISSSEIEKRFSFGQLTVPLLYKFDIYPKEIFITSGIEGSYFFKNQSKERINYGNGEKENISNQKNKSITNFAFVLSSGYNFYNSSKAIMSIEPMIKIYFKEYVVEHSGLYSFGLKFQCYTNN